jgi:hypothetical protein
MMRRILLFAPAMVMLLASGGFSGAGMAAGRADIDRRHPRGMAAAEIADRHYREWRQNFQPYHYPQSPPVWHSGPRYRVHEDRDSNAHKRRECARTTGYRTDDYYACVRPWWWPIP